MKFNVRAPLYGIQQGYALPLCAAVTQARDEKASSHSAFRMVRVMLPRCRRFALAPYRLECAELSHNYSRIL